MDFTLNVIMYCFIYFDVCLLKLNYSLMLKLSNEFHAKDYFNCATTLTELHVTFVANVITGNTLNMNAVNCISRITYQKGIYDNFL